MTDGRPMSSRRESRSKTLQQKVLDVGVLFLLGAGLIAAGMFSGILGMRLAVRGTEVVVPEITGSTADEARQILTQRDLDLQVIGERFDQNFPAKKILAQYPNSGGRLKAKRPVQVILSLGSRTHPVPDLTGSTVQVARLEVAQYNYEIGHVTRIASEGFDKDVVLSQDPEPGSSDVSNSKINLLVSSGDPGRFLMPDLTDRNLNVVEPLLREAGFQVDSITYRFYANARKGTVVKHFPEPGSLLVAKASVHLEVAR